MRIIMKINGFFVVVYHEILLIPSFTLALSFIFCGNFSNGTYDCTGNTNITLMIISIVYFISQLAFQTLYQLYMNDISFFSGIPWIEQAPRCSIYKTILNMLLSISTIIPFGLKVKIPFYTLILFITVLIHIERRSYPLFENPLVMKVTVTIEVFLFLLVFNKVVLLIFQSNISGTTICIFIITFISLSCVWITYLESIITKTLVQGISKIKRPKDFKIFI